MKRDFQIKNMKRDLIVMIFLSLSLLFILQVYVKAYVPVFSSLSEHVIDIPEGSSIKAVARILESEGLIRNAIIFNIMSRLHGMKNPKAGEYSLNPGMSPLDILSIINSGRVIQRRITIPEGLTIFQIADFLEQKGWVKKSLFLDLCFDPDILKLWGIEGPSLEGYLFPETYFFTKGISERYILESMVKQFRKVFTCQMAERAKELNFTVHEIVTLASLIEKETGLPEERPLVAAVFHNRLKERIPLQCDPTIIYGLEDFNGNITKDDLLKKTPYNTYMKSGLPPGPISNPGLSSLKAALYPANVKYKYFVSKNDESHVFSETLKEHNKAVFKFQKRRIKKHETENGNP